jgi:PAS domain S-box-containing protein
MRRWGEAAFDAYLPAETVLDQVETAVIVTDRHGNLLYANDYASRLAGFPGDFRHLIGHSFLALAFDEADVVNATELAKQVLRGRAWEGTFSNLRQDGTRVFVRAQAVPLRHPSGAIDGIVIFAREAMKRSNQREHDRFGLLERIGERLAGALEMDRTLRHVAETLVPQFADHCFIDLLTGGKLLRRIDKHAGGWQPLPGTWAQIGEQISYPEGHFCQQAMARLDTIVVEDVEAGRYPAPSPESMDTAEEVEITSVIAAPLCARGELLGVMSLALSRLTERDDLHYDAFDRDFVGAIASRVAIAIDNAMLFEEERRTALAFQTSLLPHQIPELDGLETACRYVPAKPLKAQGQGIQTQVGGDWYDVIPLSAGRVGIVIGDVEGRGARAAAIMGQLRAALRALAQDDKSPAEILRKLDEWCRTLGEVEVDAHGGQSPQTPIASCAYLVYDAWSRELSFANAGHDAPLIIVDGDVRQMEIEHRGVLLGVRAKGVGGVPPFREERRTLPPGATLVFYTDGLTERRTREDGGVYPEEETVAMVSAAVAAAAGKDVDAVADAAKDAVPGDIADDMAIVVVRSSTPDLASRQRSFPAEPIMVSEARRMAAETFSSWGMEPGQAELACLLVSEVVTNVVLHATASSRPRRELVFEGPAGAAEAGRDDAGRDGAGRDGAGRDGAGAGSTGAGSTGAGSTGTGSTGAGTAGAGASNGGLGAVALEDRWDPYDVDPQVAGREFTVRLRRGASAIWAEVFDSDLRLPRIRSAGENDEGGRGLYLVDQLATRWGSRPTPEGKAVWFEMPISPRP